MNNPLVQLSAIIYCGAKLGHSNTIWHYTVVRPHTQIGNFNKIGSMCVIGPDVIIGDSCKIQDRVGIYGPVEIGDEVFVGPGTVMCNDKYPNFKDDFVPSDGKIVIGDGVSIGANCTILPGLQIGGGAIIGAGAVVTKDVPAGETWAGVPARKLK